MFIENQRILLRSVDGLENIHRDLVQRAVSRRNYLKLDAIICINHLKLDYNVNGFVRTRAITVQLMESLRDAIMSMYLILLRKLRKFIILLLVTVE